MTDARTSAESSSLIGNLPLQYADGPDFCTVKDATGGDFALTVQPELMQMMERALLARELAQCLDVSEEERHAIAHARYQVEQASPENPDCCFDFDLVKNLLRVIDRQTVGLAQGYAPGEEKLHLFLSILASASGETSGDDSKWNWINYFCDDAEPLDTFNQASKRKLTRVTHDSDSDVSMVYLTDAGRAFIASRTPAEPTRPKSMWQSPAYDPARSMVEVVREIWQHRRHRR